MAAIKRGTSCALNNLDGFFKYIKANNKDQYEYGKIIGIWYSCNKTLKGFFRSLANSDVSHECRHVVLEAWYRNSDHCCFKSSLVLLAESLGLFKNNSST